MDIEAELEQGLARRLLCRLVRWRARSYGLERQGGFE